jgi:hypothetical protein
VMDPDAGPVGKPFTSAAVEFALAPHPGFTLTAPPSPPTPFGVYRPEYVDRSAVTHTVVHADGRREVVADPPVAEAASQTRGQKSPEPTTPSGADRADRDFGPRVYDGPTSRIPLGTWVHARSGDKGGDANLGLWVGQGQKRRDDRVAWLLATVTPDWVRTLLPEARDLDVEVHPLPGLGGVNVVVAGLLGRGVAASTRFDPQAKGLGEWARSRLVDVPEELA